MHEASTCKRFFVPLLALSLLLSGCRTRYEITLTNTDKITARTKPKRVGGFYVFKDATGKEARVSAFRVVQIETKSPWEKKKEPFSDFYRK